MAASPYYIITTYKYLVNTLMSIKIGEEFKKTKFILHKLNKLKTLKQAKNLCINMNKNLIDRQINNIGFIPDEFSFKIMKNNASYYIALKCQDINNENMIILKEFVFEDLLTNVDKYMLLA